MLGQIALERTRAEQQRRHDWEWERFLACTYIPHPKVSRASVARICCSHDKISTMKHMHAAFAAFGADFVLGAPHARACAMLACLQ